MKVLLTTDVLGGVFTYAVTLARALVHRGVDVVVATLGGRPTDAQRTALSCLREVVVHESAYRLEWMDDPWDHVERAGRWLQRLCQAARPDVIHLDHYAHGALDLGAPKLVVAHSCVVTWWRAVKGEEAPPRYDRYREVVRAGLLGADAIVAPTSAFLAELAAAHGPLPPGRVIPNGIEPSPAMPAAPNARERLVIGAGRLWDEAKNLAVLDEVAARIDWPVEVAGDPVHPEGRVLGARHARMLGPLSNGALGARLRSAAVLCHPALYEPFGLVPLEAAASGCALVLGDLPTLREVWGPAALYADPRDAGAVAGTVRRLTEDDALRVRLANAALARARALTARAQAEAYHALYAELAAPRVRGASPTAPRLEAQ